MDMDDDKEEELRQALHSLCRDFEITPNEIGAVLPGEILRHTDLECDTDVDDLYAFALRQGVGLAAPRSAAQIYADKAHCARLSIGCPRLDALLGGGLLPTGINEIAGESASGKTQCCLQYLLHAQLPTTLGGLGSDRRVMYISTEGAFPSSRFRQFAAALCARHNDDNRISPKLTEQRLADNVSVLNVYTVAELQSLLEGKLERELALGEASHVAASNPQNTEKETQEETPPPPTTTTTTTTTSNGTRLSLIVIDSIAALFRADYSREQAVQRSSDLLRIATQLQRLSATYNVCVLIVNQVADVMNNERAGFAAGVSSSAAAAAAAAAAGGGPTENKAHCTTIGKMSGGAVKPTLGLFWTQCVTMRITLRKTSTTLATMHAHTSENRAPPVHIREMSVAFAPHVAPQSMRFVVTADSVRGIA